MKYYIGREVKTAFHKRYTLWYVVGIAVLCILANLAMICFRTIYGMNDGSFGANLIIFAEGVFVIPYYSSIFISDIIFGKDYPNPHIKDKATIGLSRIQLYFGKLIATLLLACVFMVVAIVIFFGTTLILQFSDGTIDRWTILDFLEKMTVAMPLWVAGVSFGTMFLFLFKNKKRAFISFFVVVLAIPRLIMFFAADPFRLPPFTWITNILITPQFNALQFYFTMDRGKSCLLGLIYTVITCAIGIISFQKKEFS